MSFTIVLIILTGIISFQAFNNPQLRQKLLFYPAAIEQQNEWYRFISSGFIHADFAHLAVNMFVFYQFGEFVEVLFKTVFGQMLGPLIYVLFYLSAIAIASVPSYFKHQANPYYRALGASGATSAVLFADILFHPWDWFLFPPVPAIVLGVGYLWYASYMGKKGQDNIGHDAHFWGAVYGVVFILSIAILYRPDLIDVIMSSLLSPKAPPF